MKGLEAGGEGNSRGCMARQLLSEGPSKLSPRMLKASTPFRTMDPDFLVGIIGAGMSGLYAALLLKSLSIKYEILEANAERVGGRAYTYRHDRVGWCTAQPGTAAYYDYFDAGAMRFPKIRNVTERVIGDKSWSLNQYLNKELPALGARRIRPIEVSEYTMASENNIMFYNGVHVISREDGSFDLREDPLKFGVSKGGGVPDGFAQIPPSTWLQAAYGHFIDIMSQDFRQGWDRLQQVDHLSTRAYMGSSVLPEDLHIDPLNYSESVITWLETMDSASGLYDCAFTESVMDAFDFGTTEWELIEGGTQRLVDAMVVVLAGHLPQDPSQQDQQQRRRGEGSVWAPSSTEPVLKNGHEDESELFNDAGIYLGERVNKITPDGDAMSVRTQHGVRRYSHVIATLPLSVMRTIDFDGCGLAYGKQVAFRTLHYDHSVKVAIRFNRRWWRFLPQNPISSGGKSSTDLPIRTVVYPSYGNHCDDAPGWLIVSYTWAQDAARIGSIAGVKDQNELVGLCLDNLAKLHQVPRKFLDDHFAEGGNASFVMDWYSQREFQGAFALFSPGQFTSLFRHLIMSEAGGLLHFAGEATSAHHAWIVGSLNSAYRAVLHLLTQEGDIGKVNQLREQWGDVDEIDYTRVQDFL